ncbi:hypothetical protein AB833_02430 [Chromatiales bacterium (ex Bugula neritina AB1)]|nr:hypothetical protein AB833_02430 [Chromatiales bacterium (ex Bugula neritina AB1)]
MKYSEILLRGTILASALAITACGSSNDDGSAVSTTAIEANTVLSGVPTVADNNINGIGSVIFTSSLGAIDSGRHLQVAALLDEGESFTIHAYADDQLANGIDLVVSRPANTPTSLEVTVDGADISSGFTGVAADQAINILMDVHNDENPTHVLIWPAGETAFDEATTLENSEVTGSVSSQGAGAFWGLTINGAEITAAEASEDRFED